MCFEGEGGEIPCIFQSGKVEGSGACITKLYKGTVVFARKLKSIVIVEYSQVNLIKGISPKWCKIEG